MAYLLHNVSVDTVGAGVQGDGSAKGIMIFATNFGGGSVAIEISPDEGTTWLNVPYNGSPSAFTANQPLMLLKFSQTWLIRAKLVGSSGASNVNVTLDP